MFKKLCLFINYLHAHYFTNLQMTSLSSSTKPYRKMIYISFYLKNYCSISMSIFCGFIYSLSECRQPICQRFFFQLPCHLRQRHTTECLLKQSCCSAQLVQIFPRLKIKQETFLDQILIVLLFSIWTACYFWQRILMLAKHHNSSSKISICQKSIIQLTALMFRFSVNHD